MLTTHIPTFSATLSAYGKLAGKMERYDMSVRANMGSGTVGITFTRWCARTGERLSGKVFVRSGKAVLPTLEQLRQVMPPEWLATWESMWPRLEEFVLAMDGGTKLKG